MRGCVAQTESMASQSVSSISTLLLVPTELELELLEPHLADAELSAAVEVCGFGPVAAAARTAHLIETKRPSHVVLAGIAGTFCADTLPLGTACCFRQVAIDGIGVGESSRFVSARDLGFSPADLSEDTLILEPLGNNRPEGLLLTCCAASDSAEMALARRKRHPNALAEDMEGFGVALACRFATVPATIVRGISNLVGNRDKSTWEVGNAIRAAADLLNGTLASDTETGNQL